MTTQESNKLIARSCGIDWKSTLKPVYSQDPSIKTRMVSTYDPSTNADQLFEAIEVMAEKRGTQVTNFLVWLIKTYLWPDPKNITKTLKAALYQALVNYCKKL